MVALKPLNLSSHFCKLALNFEGFRNLFCLLHYFNELLFEGLLRANACFYVEILFGYVLTGNLLLNDATADAANLLHSCIELRRRDSRNDRDCLHGAFTLPRVILLVFRRDDEAA